MVYLGKFIEKFKNDIKFNISNDILPNTNFKNLFKKSGFVKESTVENLKIKEVSKKYKKYNEPEKSCTCSKKLIIPLIIGLMIAIILSITLPIVLNRKKKEIICEGMIL